jgi:hypothetical protein
MILDTVCTNLEALPRTRSAAYMPRYRVFRETFEPCVPGCTQHIAMLQRLECAQVVAVFPCLGRTGERAPTLLLRNCWEVFFSRIYSTDDGIWHGCR